MSKQYLICTTPRSGSSLLCTLLGSTGMAGMRRAPLVGQEYMLELVGRRDQRRDFGPLDRHDLQRILQGAFDRSQTPNGVAGFKLMWEQVRRLTRLLAHTAKPGTFGFNDFATLLPETTRFVWLIRRDRVKQAVSLVKAVQSQCWTSTEQERFTGFYVFDYIALRSTVKMLERHDAMWRAFFEHNSIRPLEVAYEDVVRDQRSQVQRITDHVGIPGAVADNIGEVHSRQQSEALNVLWVERFTRIRSRGSIVRSLCTAWSLPGWIGLRVISRLRAAQRVRRLSSEEQLEPR